MPPDYSSPFLFAMLVPSARSSFSPLFFFVRARAHNNTSQPLNIYAIERNSRYRRRFIPSRLIAGIFIAIWSRSTNDSSKEITRNTPLRDFYTHNIYTRSSIKEFLKRGISLKQDCVLIGAKDRHANGLSGDEDSTAILILRIRIKKILGCVSD